MNTVETISTRDAVVEMIRKMPPDVTVADVMASLYVRLVVDEGLAQLDRGENVPHDEVMKRVAKWLT